MEIGNVKVEELLDISNSGLTLIVGVISALSVLLTALFRGGMYLYYRGYYDAWNIPAEYIEMDSKDMLLKFFIVIIAVVLMMGLSTFFVYFWKNNKREKNGGKLFLKRIGMLLLIVISGACILFAFFLSEFSPTEIVELLLAGTLGLYIEICFLIFLWGYLVFVMGTTGYELLKVHEKGKVGEDEIKASEEIEKTQKRRKQVVRMCYLGCFLAVFLVVFIEAVGVYQNKKTLTEDCKNINVVSIEDKKYALVGKYEDTWILKAVFEVDGAIIVNKDHFMIADITGCDIFVKELKTGTLKDCLLGSSDFEIMVKNSGEE